GNAPAHRLHHFRQRVDGSPAAVLAATAVIGDDEAVDAVLDCELRILGGQYALEHDLHVRRVAQAAHEVPGQIRRYHALEARQIDALVVGPGARSPDDARLVAVSAYAPVDAAQAGKCFLIAARDAVDSERHDRTARRLCTFHQGLGHLPTG